MGINRPPQTGAPAPFLLPYRLTGIYGIPFLNIADSFALEPGAADPDELIRWMTHWWINGVQAGPEIWGVFDVWNATAPEGSARARVGAFKVLLVKDGRVRRVSEHGKYVDQVVFRSLRVRYQFPETRLGEQALAFVTSYVGAYESGTLGAHPDSFEFADADYCEIVDISPGVVQYEPLERGLKNLTGGV